MYRSRVRRLAAILLGGMLPASSSAWSIPPDTYPQSPITLVVGYGPGGATDTIARLIARSISEDLGQPLVVENKSGASSNVGAESVARSAADGYTLYVGTVANTINRTLFRTLNYDFVRDFTPVGRIANVTNVLVIKEGLPISNVREYIAYARENPGKLTCASSGIGSSIHLSCDLFKVRTGTDILHVPYRGGGPALNALLGGQVDSMFDNLPSALPHIRSGKLRAIGVTAARRTTFAPEIPAIATAGLTDFEVDSWFGLMAPAGTPPAIVARLNAALNKALTRADLQNAYADRGYTVPAGDNSPEAFGRFIDAEIGKWQTVIQAANLTAE
nr:tripartite tricarboxylate transporter substrate binding protein [Bordetella genomosp. 11]